MSSYYDDLPSTSSLSFTDYPCVTTYVITMVFNARAYKEELVALPNCLAHPHFVEKVGWTKQDTGHLLVSQSTGEEIVAITVGKVSPFRLQCGPAGNFRSDSKVQNDFSKAKFQLTLDMPEEPALVPVYKAGLTTLTKLQKSASSTNDNRNLLQDEGDLTSIRFAAKLFEKRVRASFNHLPPKLFLTLLPTSHSTWLTTRSILKTSKTMT